MRKAPLRRPDSPLHFLWETRKGELKHNNELVVTNLRHKEALQDALHSLQLVERSIEDGMPEDFYSIDLTSAYASLGKIIGEEVDEDVVNEIFSKSCMGT